MKVNTIQPTSQIKQPIIKRIKKALVKPFTNLKELVCDVFEYQKPKYVIVDGKKVKTGCSWLSPRDLPNCVSGLNDWAGAKVQKIVLAPEDVERLEKLPYEEKIKARWELIKAGKYKVEDY